MLSLNLKYNHKSITVIIFWMTLQELILLGLQRRTMALIFLVQDLILKYSKNLDVLTQDTKFALIHIWACLFIWLCLISLIGVGKYLIDRFNLSSKWPFLNRYFLLRAKFQLYYFTLHSLLIFIMLLILLIINLMALIRSF